MLEGFSIDGLLGLEGGDVVGGNGVEKMNVCNVVSSTIVGKVMVKVSSNSSSCVFLDIAAGGFPCSMKSHPVDIPNANRPPRLLSDRLY